MHGRPKSSAAAAAVAGARSDQNAASASRSHSSRAVAVPVTMPARSMCLLLSSPCPGSGSNITTGSPAAKASRQVSPPAFATRASHAAIRPGIRSVNPNTTARPSCSSVSSRRLRPALCPVTTTGLRPGTDATARAAPCRFPTPQAPPTISTARSPAAIPSRCCICERSPGAAGSVGTGGRTARMPVTQARPTPRLSSSSGCTQAGCGSKSVISAQHGTRSRPVRRSRASTIETMG